MQKIINNTMDIYAIYLRKSRKDEEAEMHGEGDTLKRHENILLNLAKSMDLSIGKIYREIVSGDSIAARPVMQELLKDVEAGLWSGILVVEVERLARRQYSRPGYSYKRFYVFKYKNHNTIKNV